MRLGRVCALETERIAFQSAKPTLAHAAASSRLQCMRALTSDLGAYFKERILLEEVYLKSLAKLNGKLSNELTPALAALPLSPSQLQTQLGAWNDVLAQVAAELVTKSNSHQAFKLKVAEQVQSPLSNSLASRAWTSWTEEDNRLTSTVKSFDNEADKVNKVSLAFAHSTSCTLADHRHAQAQAKSATKSSKSTTSKLLSAQSSLTFISAELKSSLPPFLAMSQSLETSQSNIIKESLLLYGTLSSDQARAEMEVGERFVGAVLAVEGEVEMRTWALREGLAAGGSAGFIEAAPSMSEFGANNNTVRGQSNGGANDGTIRQSARANNVGANLMDDNEISRNDYDDGQGEMETLSPSRFTPTNLPPAIVIPPSSFPSSAPQTLPLPSPALSTTSSRSRSRQQPREDRVPPPAAAPLDLPTVPPPPPPRSESYRSQTDTTSRETNSGGGGFKLPGFLGGNSGRDRTLSTSTSGDNAGGAGYGSLEAEERRGGDGRSIDSRQSNDNYASTSRPEPVASAVTPTKSVKAKRRESIVPFAANLFRRQSKMVPIPASFTPSTPLPPSPLPPTSSSVSRDAPESFSDPSRAAPSRKDSTLSAGLVDEDGYSVKPDGYDRAISGGLMGADSDEEDMPG